MSNIESRDNLNEFAQFTRAIDSMSKRPATTYIGSAIENSINTEYILNHQPQLYRVLIRTVCKANTQNRGDSDRFK